MEIEERARVEDKWDVRLKGASDLLMLVRGRKDAAKNKAAIKTR